LEDEKPVSSSNKRKDPHSAPRPSNPKLQPQTSTQNPNPQRQTQPQPPTTSSAAEFIADLDQIRINAEAYNTPGHGRFSAQPVVAIATNMVAFARVSGRRRGCFFEGGDREVLGGLRGSEASLIRLGVVGAVLG